MMIIITPDSCSILFESFLITATIGRINAAVFYLFLYSTISVHNNFLIYFVFIETKELPIGAAKQLLIIKTKHQCLL